MHYASLTSTNTSASVAAALSMVRAVGKPIMLVAQAFGGGGGWKRSPSAREERLMTYLGLLYDCVAIQYFIRSGEWAPSVPIGPDPCIHDLFLSLGSLGTQSPAPISFPYAASAWGEIRTVAAEVLAIQSALAGGVRITNVTTSSKR
jgi:hypothetical protein